MTASLLSNVFQAFTGSGAKSITNPTGTDAGDYLTAFVAAITVPIVTPPSGWSLLSGCTGVYVKSLSAPASTAENWDFGAADGGICICAVRGGSPPLGKSNAINSSGTLTWPFPSLDVSSQSDTKFVLAAAQIYGNNPSGAGAVPSGYTNIRISIGTGSGSELNINRGTATGSPLVVPSITSLQPATNFITSEVSFGPVAPALIVAGALKKISGSAALKLGDKLTIAGALKKVSGSAVIDVATNKLVVAGALQKVSGSAAIQIANGIAISGALKKVGGSAAIIIPTGVTVAGALPTLSGSADIDVTPENYLVLAGALPSLSGSADVALGDELSIAGLLAMLSGSGSIEVATAFDVAGALPALNGSAAVFVASRVALTVAGALPLVGGTSEIAIHTLVAIAGQLAGMGASGHIRDAPIEFPHDPFVIITVPLYDRTIVLAEFGDRVTVLPGADRIIDMPVQVTTIVVSEAG